MDRKVFVHCVWIWVGIGLLGCSSIEDSGDYKTVGSVAQPLSNPTCSGTVEVSALIDGRSLLHIIPDGIYWEHLSKAGPGMHAYQTLPTSVDATIAGTTTSTAWCPTWENGCDTCDGSCGELREPMFSNLLFLDMFPEPLQNFELTSCNGRNTCTLAQAPSSANGFEAIIDFDDVAPPGPDYYSAIVSYDFCSPCPLGQYTAGTRFIGSPIWADEDFFPSLAAIDAAAASSNVFVYVTNSFRQAGHTLEGTIVPPAVTSNHLVGHAIDMNVQYTDAEGNTVLANSTVLSQAVLPAPVAAFITAVKAAGLRWGGDFQRKDVVHFDDGFNSDPIAWQSAFDTLQGCVETAGFVVRVHSPVDVMITDPAGRVLGVDDTGTPVNSIGDNGLDSGPGEPRTFAILKPLPGEYTIWAFGTGNGPYTIELFNAMEIGSPLQSVVAADEGITLTGNANVGMIRTMSFVLSPEEPEMMRDITVPPPPEFLSFEDETLLWTSSGSIGLNENASHGNHSLEITGCGWMEIHSPQFASSQLPAVEDSIAFDLYIPENQSNPWWVGDVGILISIPSAGIYHQWLGQQLLNDLDRGVWVEGEVALPANVKSALEATHPDVTLHLAVNTGSCAEPILIDHIRFAEDIVPPDYCHENNDCSDQEYCFLAECALETGVCEEKPQLCPLLWEPVCGCDGETYANECLAAAEGVSVDYEGECQDPPVV